MAKKDPAAFYAAGRYEEAAALFAIRTTRSPQDVDAWLGRGQCLLALARPGEAWLSLQKAWTLCPSDARSRAVVGDARGQAAAGMGHSAAAEQLYRESLAATPRHETRARLGTLLLNLGRVEEALPILEQAAREGGSVATIASLASALVASSQPSAALALLDRVAAGQESVGPVAFARARALLDLRRPAEALAALDRAARVSPNQVALFLHARARAYDQLDDIPAAAAAYTAMHEARRLRVDPDALLADADNILANYPSNHRFTPAPPAPAAAAQPVLIVGLPRSGTSLTEQMLAAHPLVHACGERTHLEDLATKLGAALGVPWPDNANVVYRGALSGGTAWRHAFSSGAPPQARVLTDKLPSNLFRLGLAAQLLPDASAIWLRRGLMDTLLSCWQQSFGPQHPWTSTWEGLAAMAAATEIVGERWLEDAPMPICVVRYEELVSSPETEARDILNFLGLPWDPAVLAPEAVERPIATASRLQVREPINPRSVGRWRRYEAQLAPLMDALVAQGLDPE